MDNRLFYWEHAVISQPDVEQTVTVVFKSGDIGLFTYRKVNREWFIRNVARWAKETTFTYEQLSKSEDFVKDACFNWGCDMDGHNHISGCRQCAAKNILGIEG